MSNDRSAGTHRTLRECVALDYLRDGQAEWNDLNPEERHGVVEMARWALEDAAEDDLDTHLWADETLDPETARDRPTSERLVFGAGGDV